LPLPSELDSLVRWSPEGRALDYVDSHDPSNIWRLPNDASNAVPLTHLTSDPITDFAWSIDGTRLAWISSDVRHDVIIFRRGAKGK